MSTEGYIIIAGLLVFVAAIAIALAVGKWQIVVVGGVIFALSFLPSIINANTKADKCREAGGRPASSGACVDPNIFITPAP